jgi:1-deoxy-D-xylulose-5-phosphate synthase
VALQNLPVTFAIDRAGMVGSDGATHQGSFDLSFLRCIPNMVIMAPADEDECRQMLYTATTVKGPAAVRYPRGAGPGTALVQQMTALPLGRAEIRRQGRTGLALIAVGALVAPAQKIAERLDATLVNLRFVKPLDENLLIDIASRHSAIVTLEENVVAGGAGSAVGELLASQDLQVSLLHIGIPDRFIEHGSREDCLALAGLDAASLNATIERWWARHSATRARSVGAL